MKLKAGFDYHSLTTFVQKLDNQKKLIFQSRFNLKLFGRSPQKLRSGYSFYPR
jgi:hypothetical protein